MIHIVRPTDVDAWIQSAHRVGIAVAELTDTISTGRQFFDVVVGPLHFPSYFGKNKDAFNDCLRGLDEAWPAPGYLLAIRDANELWQSEPAFVHWLFEDWLAVGEERRLWGRPTMHLVWQLKTYQDRIKFPPV